ncbi:hypothetical protein DPMN_129403 [Dreissena polymorpha]|uniref:Uncharacterized protein n=1 Tax=Dreissena polymorpha TaxID=45954 RepID=A0A9D4JXB6_DREPO|nr:hypothetical protein DPMN_129403 [Dreissena polymorpha]
MQKRLLWAEEKTEGIQYRLNLSSCTGPGGQSYWSSGSSGTGAGDLSRGDLIVLWYLSLASNVVLSRGSIETAPEGQWLWSRDSIGIGSVDLVVLWSRGSSGTGPGDLMSRGSIETVQGDLVIMLQGDFVVLCIGTGPGGTSYWFCSREEILWNSFRGSILMVLVQQVYFYWSRGSSVNVSLDLVVLVQGLIFGTVPGDRVWYWPRGSMVLWYWSRGDLVWCWFMESIVLVQWSSDTGPGNGFSVVLVHGGIKCYTGPGDVVRSSGTDQRSCVILWFRGSNDTLIQGWYWSRISSGTQWSRDLVVLGSSVVLIQGSYNMHILSSNCPALSN